jgi:hypothetical protein
MRGKNLPGRPAEGKKVELSKLEPPAEAATASK